MCDQNPRNCSLRDKHRGPCVPALDLNKLVENGIQELMQELEEFQR